MTFIPKDKWDETFTLVPRLSVDAIYIKDGKVLLVQRSHEPFKGWWITPGGFVDKGERVAEAAEREFFEETGLKGKATKILGIYDDPDRDPRGHVVTVAYLIESTAGKIKISEESYDVKFFDVNKLPENIVQDSKGMIIDALNLIADKKSRKKVV